MGSQDHIAGAIDNAVIAIGRHIVKQLQYGFISLFGSGGLMGANIDKYHN